MGVIRPARLNRRSSQADWGLDPTAAPDPFDTDLHMTAADRRLATGLLAALAAFGSSPAARADVPAAAVAAAAATIEVRAAQR